jgi:hypothetical protein
MLRVLIQIELKKLSGVLSGHNREIKGKEYFQNALSGERSSFKMKCIQK